MSDKDVCSAGVDQQRKCPPLSEAAMSAVRKWLMKAFGQDACCDLRAAASRAPDLAVEDRAQIGDLASLVESRCVGMSHDV